jgi:hypothetical protein
MRCRTQRMARRRSANLVIPLFLDSIACVTAVTLRPKLAQLLSPHGEMWQVTEPSPEASTP